MKNSSKDIGPAGWALLTVSADGLDVDIFPTEEKATEAAMSWMTGFVTDGPENPPDTLEELWALVQSIHGFFFADDYRIQPIYANGE